MFCKINTQYFLNKYIYSKFPFTILSKKETAHEATTQSKQLRHLTSSCCSALLSSRGSSASSPQRWWTAANRRQQLSTLARSLMAKHSFFSSAGSRVNSSLCKRRVPDTAGRVDTCDDHPVKTVNLPGFFFFFSLRQEANGKTDRRS